MRTSDRLLGPAALLLVAVLAHATVFAGSGIAQEKPAAEGNASAEAAELSADAIAARDIALARQLAVYGYRTQTPEPYLAAARILVQTSYRDPDFEGRTEGEGGEETDKAGPPKLNVSFLLAAARELAGDDESVAAVADHLEGSMEKGRQGGPAVHSDRVLAGYTDYYEITFRGGESAIIEVVGDGDTDLDCWVYDENGNLIDSDTDYTDHCILMWTPRWTGPFELQIKNYGSVWNGYVLSTN